MTNMTATYSPEDNKLRLSSATRLPTSDFELLKAAGFRWAAVQAVFVAPMWTPEREDLLLNLCGEIGDEDTSLVDRAEQRAERFVDYRESRLQDAKAAREGVEAIVEHIPLGQPILVGHHSEKRARKDAERISTGMRKAVSMWDTATYWASRAAGALRHAKYKQLPDVRARRIKSIEADARKAARNLAETGDAMALLQGSEMTATKAKAIASVTPCLYGMWSKLNADPESFEQIISDSLALLERSRARQERWQAHYENRLSYERAMLDAQGGLTADKFNIVAGGAVRIGGEWLKVLRVNRAGGRVSSVTTDARYVPKRGIEEVQDYREPSADQLAATEAACKLPPLCNYPGAAAVCMTKAEWAKIHKDYKGSRELGQAAVRPRFGRPDVATQEEEVPAVGRHRIRVVVQGGALRPVYLTDQKRKDPPAPVLVDREPAGDEEDSGFNASEADAPSPSPRPAPVRSEDEAAIDAMRAQLGGGGIQAVRSEQLFPTPPDLARRMVDLAGLADCMTLLEPSAGTGRLLQAVRDSGAAVVSTSIELNPRLCEALRLSYADVRQGDFLDFGGDVLGSFDVVLMNPPFRNASDISHILHALQFVRDGGRLVALCADGPRQNEKLRPLTLHGGSWEPLPPGTFQAEGTGVRTVLLTIQR
ncbi:phospholipid N-methyltransferase [Stenotrophomonas sp. PvP093]|uniref:DUF3560 domain-containing protein n=1 Tax=unclassified Stenotrophomonas TaxID=196198 RepID=UPI001AEA2240|nr:DUF3560 domain-containing protein [Stenotrophomonas sp. PvP093]MBP2480184.1 phospholipid N-methyltransferase [Stenotrophomonas sp. PvP093]